MEGEVNGAQIRWRTERQYRMGAHAEVMGWVERRLQVGVGVGIYTLRSLAIDNIFCLMFKLYWRCSFFNW